MLLRRGVRPFLLRWRGKAVIDAQIFCEMDIFLLLCGKNKANFFKIDTYDTQELKLTIHELVNKTDDPDVLQGMYLLLKKLLAADDDIVGFEADGTPITAEDFIHSILDAEEDIEAGNGIPHAAMKAKYGAR